jgi:hypothetical protein
MGIPPILLCTDSIAKKFLLVKGFQQKNLYHFRGESAIIMHSDKMREVIG